MVKSGVQEMSSSRPMSSPNVSRTKCTCARKSSDIASTAHGDLLEKSQITLEYSPEKTSNETDFLLTRDEIVARRKLKVAARKQIKKLEKIQLNEKVEKAQFSLHLVSAEDFPALDSHKTIKRINTYKQNTSTNAENNSRVESPIFNETKNSKTVEKSWKPKVRDPIHIDLSKALLIKNEKHKPESKKVDPPPSRNLLAGNILDSDNPTRKKGKVRPDKVQKPTKLKSYILNERKKKLSESKVNNPLMSKCSLTETKEKNNTREVEVDIKSSFSNSNLSKSVTDNERKLAITNYESQVCTIFPAKIHSRRFREYCTNCLTEGLISSVCTLLEKIAYFQDRMFAREPIKASAKRRYVAGINQVCKYLQIRKVKLLIIAPDLEKIAGEGGLDERVQFFKKEAESQEIPCVFGPNRKRLGKAVKKNILVSCVAVLSYEGAEEQYAKLLEELNESKKKYLRLTGCDEIGPTKNVHDIPLSDNESPADGEDVTSSLLAALRDELSLGDRLLNAIQHST